mmetsp:Transcript_15436/g.16698  ORF Transcript_15436/g.16698 Transcript_15436/m.16698 type:complete len:148 (-) Transcript_15436:120-563(-)
MCGNLYVTSLHNILYLYLYLCLHQCATQATLSKEDEATGLYHTFPDFFLHHQDVTLVSSTLHHPPEETNIHHNNKQTTIHPFIQNQPLYIYIYTRFTTQHNTKSFIQIYPSPSIHPSITDTTVVQSSILPKYSWGINPGGGGILIHF